MHGAWVAGNRRGPLRCKAALSRIPPGNRPRARADSSGLDHARGARLLLPGGDPVSIGGGIALALSGNPGASPPAHHPERTRRAGGPGNGKGARVRRGLERGDGSLERRGDPLRNRALSALLSRLGSAGHGGRAPVELCGYPGQGGRSGTSLRRDPGKGGPDALSRPGMRHGLFRRESRRRSCGRRSGASLDALLGAFTALALLTSIQRVRAIHQILGDRRA